MHGFLNVFGAAACWPTSRALAAEAICAAVLAETDPAAFRLDERRLRLARPRGRRRRPRAPVAPRPALAGFGSCSFDEPGDGSAVASPCSIETRTWTEIMDPTCDPSSRQLRRRRPPSPTSPSRTCPGAWPSRGGRQSPRCGVAHRRPGRGPGGAAARPTCSTVAGLPGRRVRRRPVLNAFMALGAACRRDPRPRSPNCSRPIAPTLRDDAALREPGAASRRRSPCTCRCASATTPISTPAASTPPTWASCSAARTTP